MAAGYSGTALVRKLGIRAGSRVCVLDAPDSYGRIVPDLPPDLRFVAIGDAPVDLVHVFATRRRPLAAHLARARRTLAQAGAVWVSWPKKASGAASEIDENAVRALALDAGFVDVKVCAIDGVWSGLKLVIRVADRR